MRGGPNRFPYFVRYFLKQYTTKTEATKQAVMSILDGYLDEAEAREDAELMRQTDGIRYDVRGFEITPATLEHALRELAKHPEWRGEIWAA